MDSGGESDGQGGRVTCDVVRWRQDVTGLKTDSLGADSFAGSTRGGLVGTATVEEKQAGREVYRPAHMGASLQGASMFIEHTPWHAKTHTYILSQCHGSMTKIHMGGSWNVKCIIGIIRYGMKENRI